MVKPFGKAVAWGVIYFFVACLLQNYVFTHTHVFFAQSGQSAEAAFVSALGYLSGYRAGRRDPNSSSLTGALVFGAIYFMALCFFHNYLDTPPHAFFADSNSLLPTSIVAAVGFIYGCSNGKRDCVYAY